MWLLKQHNCMVNSELTRSQTGQCFSERWLKIQADEHPTLADSIEQALPWLGEQLNCDRVFLYVRSPQTQLGRVPFCWVRHADIPKVYDPDWKYEPPSLPERDPMFAAALQAQPSLFIKDVQTANPDMVNRDFEARNFGHRALIHAHLCIERKLWGILQACTFEDPREWSRSDRHLIEQAVGWLAPYVMEYVNRQAPTPEPC